MEKTKEIFNKIKEANSILVTAHINPDGDAIGSSLAMYNYLKQSDKDVDILLKDVPTSFSFLSSFNEIIDEEKIKNQYDIVIVLDCASKQRILLDIDKITFESLIVFDHHITHEVFSEYTILDSQACATCQIIFDCFKMLNIEISKPIAECIFTGILTDTGCFKHSNVTSHTFDTASQLLQLGVNSNQITQDILDKMSLNKFELVKKAMNDIEIIDTKISYLYIDKETLDKHSQDENGIHEGLVNLGRDIENIEVSIFIRQLDVNEYKVSMRSNRYVDLSKIAQNYGGGGHIRAAGIKYSGNLEVLKDMLISEIKKQL